MLVTDPKQRASLAEIMTHPWMNKGFNSPPENYLPHREPLQLPLDQEVIEKMTGFDFGSPEYIKSQLTKVLESEDYQHALRLNFREQQPAHNYTERKRGVFDFYKRRNSAASRDTLSAPSAEAVQLGNDPLNAYSPLISTYHLVKEKLDRERSEARPGALGLRQAPSEVQVPDLQAPEAAHTNQYQLPGDKDTGRRSRPRARTHGEDEVTEGMKGLHSSSPSAHAVQVSHHDTPAKKESTAAGLLRRFSTRRTKDRSRDVERERTSTPNTPTLNVQPPADSASPINRGFSVRRTRRAEPSPGVVSSNSSQQQQDLLTAPGSADRSARSNKFLERSASVNSADYRTRRAARRSDADAIDVAADRQPPSTSGSDQVGPNTQKDVAGGRTGGRTHTARITVFPPKAPCRREPGAGDAVPVRPRVGSSTCRTGASAPLPGSTPRLRSGRRPGGVRGRPRSARSSALPRSARTALLTRDHRRAHDLGRPPRPYLRRPGDQGNRRPYAGSGRKLLARIW